MFHFITKVVLFFSLSIGLYAANGLSQKHLVSVSPETSASAVSADTAIEIVFDRPVVAKSLKKQTIKLKNKTTKEKVEGTTALVGESTLVFTPSEPLVTGKHKVVVKQVKLQKSATQQKCEPSTRFEKFVYWFCSRLYDEPSECGWCQYVCQNSDTIKTKNIKYMFTVDDDTPQVETIILNKTSVELHEGNETTLIVTANYDDNSSKDITLEVEWEINDTNIVSIINGSLKALKEGQTTIEAKYDRKTSEALTITVYKEINGYKLPPEPDPVVNDATLLGIDSNGNGVRDDVERYIVIRYSQDPKYPKTKTAIALQYAWASQKILENPTIESKKYIDDALDCQYYWAGKETDKHTQGLSGFEKGKYRRGLKLLTDPVLKDKIYNTRARLTQKFSFNAALSGNIFDGRDESIDNCQTNIDVLGE